jgi:expansin (peptidoglycan-binding protein)
MVLKVFLQVMQDFIIRYRRLWRFFVAILGITSIGLAGSLAYAQTDSEPEPEQSTETLIYIPYTQAREPKLLEYLPFNPLVPRDGKATLYEDLSRADCLGEVPSDTHLIAGINSWDFSGVRVPGVQNGFSAWLCGAYLEVTGPKGSVVVQIVDRCRLCEINDLSLPREVLDQIGEAGSEEVAITWKLAKVELEGPVEYHFTELSSGRQTGLQIKNHATPILMVEFAAETPTGYLTVGVRNEYNVFITHAPLLGERIYRITDIFGQTITDTITVSYDKSPFLSSSQFPSQP